MGSRFNSLELAAFDPSRALQSARSDVLDLYELPPCGRLLLDVGADERASRNAIEAAFGLVLPGEPNTVMVGEPLVAWLGPGRFMLLCAIDQAGGLMERVSTLVSEYGGLCLDISAAKVALRVCGTAAEDCLAGLVAIDLRRSSLGIGACAQTKLLQAGALILRTPDGSGFDLHVDRSFAAYTWRALLTAGGEFGLRPPLQGIPA